MNIMQIISGRQINGATRHCLLLCRELARRGHHISLVCPPDAWIARQADRSGIERLPSDLHRWPADELRRIAVAARKRRIDVLHTHMSRAHFFGVLLRMLSGIPCVATAHNRHVQLHWMLNDLVIAVSEATRSFHRRRNLVLPRRIVTIHNFVEPPQTVSPDLSLRSSLRRSLGGDDSTLLLGTVGNVIPRKGLLFLVQALPRVLAQVANVRLAVIGEPVAPEYAARVKAAAARLGLAEKISWAGLRPDVWQVLPALDLFVLPSLEESLPLAILEAMAAGLPVVATAVGGIPECICHGQTGLLVPPARSDALAAAIILLLVDPARRHRLGQTARRRVLDQFSLPVQAARIEAALASVLLRRRAAA